MNVELSVGAILLVIFLLAFLVESLVEYLFGALFDHVPTLIKFKWCLMYISLVVGIIGAFVYQFDLVYLIGLYVRAGIATTVFGIILTGAAIGRGANYLHDLVKRYFVKPTQE